MIIPDYSDWESSFQKFLRSENLNISWSNHQQQQHKQEHEEQQQSMCYGYQLLYLLYNSVW